MKLLVSERDEFCWEYLCILVNIVGKALSTQIVGGEKLQFHSPYLKKIKLSILLRCTKKCPGFFTCSVSFN